MHGYFDVLRDVPHKISPAWYAGLKLFNLSFYVGKFQKGVDQALTYYK